MKNLLRALLLLSTASLAQAQGNLEQPRQGTAISTSQQGGVTAGYVENVHLDDLPDDPLRRDLSLKLLGFHNLYTSLVSATPSLFTVILDKQDPLVRNVPAVGLNYSFQAIDGDLSDEIDVATCQLDSPDLWLIGIRYRSIKEGGQLRLLMEPIKKRDQWLLDRLCAGLNRPISWLYASETGGGDLTVADNLFAEGQPSSFMMTAEGDIATSAEYEITQGYWHEAFRNTLPGLAGMDGRDPRVTAATEQALLHGREVPLPITVDAPDMRTPYPVEARAKYGALLSTLDQQWSEYLRKNPMVINGLTLPMTDTANHFIKTFNSSTIGGREFWSAGQQLRILRLRVNCAAARFLVEQGYAGPRSVPDFGKC